MSAARHRRFCGVCGRVIGPTNRTWSDPIAYCAAHGDLAALDTVPPDPLTSLPMQADGLNVCQVCRGSGLLFDGTECDNCAGFGRTGGRRGRSTPTEMGGIE